MCQNHVECITSSFSKALDEWMNVYASHFQLSISNGNNGMLVVSDQWIKLDIGKTITK